MQKRINRNQAKELFRITPISELQESADANRRERFKDNIITYIVDANPNYTNICNINCKFCAFYRTPNHPEAYIYNIDQIRELMLTMRANKVKTVLLQGGVYPGISINYLKSIVQLAVEEFPDIHPHFFSAVEIHNAATVSNIPLETALQILWDAGLRTIPGGGAEILSENIRKKISPKKMGPNGWINFHHTAHKIGFKTTATMMFGHIETIDDILCHLDSLRVHQDKIPGFSSFIPWSYKLGNNPLSRLVNHQANAETYYRILAISRIYLDNFEHIGASWFGEGKEIGKEALKYGADDFGGTVFAESVHKSAGWEVTETSTGIQDLISQAGFIPVERNSFYERIY